MASKEKTSESGNPIYIYSEEERRSGPVTSSSTDVELIENHIELKKGADARFGLFDKNRLDDIVNNDRVNVGKNKWYQLW